jgi:endonuclease/exonuclease/phosphatase family metal-dependent hydrolase
MTIAYFMDFNTNNDTEEWNKLLKEELNFALRGYNTWHQAHST